MKEENVVLQKSYAFAVRIVRLSQFLVKDKQAFQLADQIRRSGTSIGANMEEAVGGQSRKDFVSKCSIAYKETRETHYWLRLLRDTDYIDIPQSHSLLLDCEELLKILTAIIRSTKSGDA
ncbi:four helix bundle protein [Hymenobacter sp. BT770]|uniref:four helix bundle protein n=1 Tax=Hymenobacter sp. BT770 TaxID=2886942 RepID=UPI001D11AD4D|nr:four helix bundle protein [Hymenobacter sp. BT770]MCC3151968.1 four helix bundle protein [Hymenobacter sp. BT770]MDO3417078.1 four helix bundle protein [Hymenobacter sp. BT770]